MASRKYKADRARRNGEARFYATVRPQAAVDVTDTYPADIADGPCPMLDVLTFGGAR